MKVHKFEDGTFGIKDERLYNIYKRPVEVFFCFTEPPRWTEDANVVGTRTTQQRAEHTLNVLKILYRDEKEHLSKTLRTTK